MRRLPKCYKYCILQHSIFSGPVKPWIDQISNYQERGYEIHITDDNLVRFHKHEKARIEIFFTNINKIFKTKKAAATKLESLMKEYDNELVKIGDKTPLQNHIEDSNANNVVSQNLYTELFKLMD